MKVPDTVDSTDGITLQLYDFGGDGPPLLLSHATGFCGQVWLPVAEQLGPHFHCVGFDFRAHGRSTRPEDGLLPWRGMGEDVLAVVAAISPDRPIAAVGHSMGGTSLVLAETSRPGTLSMGWTFEPILFDEATDGAPRQPSEISEGARRRRATFADRDEVFERYGSKPPLDVLDERALRAYVDHGFEDLDDGSVTLRCRPEDEASVFEHHNSGAKRIIGDLTIPFAVAASGDGRAPALSVVEVAAEHRQLELFQYDDLTHMGPLEDPERIAADILAWVTRTAQS